MSSASTACHAAALLLGAAVLEGCVDTDATVFVDAYVDDPVATVAQETLVSTISGSFTLRMHLGPRASGPAQVELGALSVTSLDHTTTYVDVLQVQTSSPFPVTVPVDSDVTLSVVFDAEDNLLETDVYDAICQAQTIDIWGTLDDSLRGGATTVRSSGFSVGGCP